MNQKRLYITLFNAQHKELFSDFICHIDAVDSHTVIYLKFNYSEADVIRVPFHLQFAQIQNGKVNLYYSNGTYAEIVRK
jgi:hypothetical protein